MSKPNKKHNDHLLPLFKGKAAISIFDTMNHSHIKPYMDEERESDERTIGEILQHKFLKTKNHQSKHR